MIYHLSQCNNFFLSYLLLTCVLNLDNSLCFVVCKNLRFKNYLPTSDGCKLLTLELIVTIVFTMLCLLSKWLRYYIFDAYELSKAVESKQTSTVNRSQYRRSRLDSKFLSIPASDFCSAFAVSATNLACISCGHPCALQWPCSMTKNKYRLDWSVLTNEK